MQELIKQEQFELEVLDTLNSRRLLKDLVFGGGTMLRLCFGLNRYSLDLDFWVVKEINFKRLFQELKDCLSGQYQLSDAAAKFYTLLIELKSKNYPRSLKIEIRKEPKRIKTEQAIAYSSHSNAQVFLRVVSLKDMMKAKIQAFLARREIRDAFDIEFLFKRGIGLEEGTPEELKRVLAAIQALTPKDYKMKLGSLLEAKERQYYAAENFKLLRGQILALTRG